MLHVVPKSINTFVRNVVVNHPNSFNCKVFRERVERAGGAAEGVPALGGLGVLDQEDEHDVSHQFLGNGYALPAEQFAPAPMMGRGDANWGPSEEYRFLIEPEEPSGHPESFDLRKHDVFYLMLSADPNPAMIAFEIVSTEAVNNIPPFSVRYVCNRRDDLAVPAGA